MLETLSLQASSSLNTNPFQEKRPLLRLIVSNPYPQQNMTPEHKLWLNNHTMCNIQSKAPYLYEMILEDLSHYLRCALALEVNSGAVICHFPVIDDEELLELVEEDDTLYSIIILQFHMKILDQLLLFCLNQNALTLIIFADDVQTDTFGIYHNFLIDKNLTSPNGKTEIVIPVHSKAYEAWIDFKEDIDLMFRQTLWQSQRFNLAIREYLKTHPLA